MILIGVLFLFILNLMLQLLIGNYGLYVPLCAWSIYYFGLTLNWRQTLWLTLAAGLMLDVIYARGELISPLTLGVFAATGIIWKIRYSGNLINIAIGGVIATAGGFALLYVPLRNSSGKDFSDLELLTHGFFWCAAAASLLPLLIRIWDAILERLPGYPAIFRGGISVWRATGRKS